jgi:hypothetical protein
MRRAGGFFLAVLISSGAGFSQRITRNFGSVVFPGGATNSGIGITRTFGSAVFPGGSPTSPVVPSSGGRITAPQAFRGVPAGVPLPARSPLISTVPTSNNFGFNNFNNFNSFNRGNGNFNNSFRGKGNRVPGTVIYYPVYVGGGYGGYGGYYDPSAFTPDAMAQQAFVPQQPNMTMAYPQQQQEARPTIIEMRPDGQYTTRQQAVPPPYLAADPRQQQMAAPQDSPDQPHCLIAFKDHTVYSSVAYWFDGETLHYFTDGSTHNQASVSLIDRPLTERLNREMGIDFKMPPAK